MKLPDRNARDSALYLTTAAVCTVFFLARTIGIEARWSALLRSWLIACAGPLVFIFAYSRFLSVKPGDGRPRRWIALLHILMAITTAGLFVYLSPFQKNPVRNVDFSILALMVVFALQVLFLVSSFFLLLKNRSTFAAFAAFSFWPYWLFLALATEERWFQDDAIQAGYRWFFLMAPLFCAFAAGTLRNRPVLANSTALASILGVPWLYPEIIRGNGYYNVWLMLNIPDVLDRPTFVWPAIFCVGLIMLTVITAAIRLLPSRWRIRQHPLRDRTWPALVVCAIVLGIWFSQSVTPYRIPGAADYFGSPLLQILHVEKRGLQFHETCVTVVRGYREEIRSVSFWEDNRRLFQYRFMQKRAVANPSTAVVERIRNFLKSSASEERRSDPVKPIRSWNADAWYLSAVRSGFTVYGTPNNSGPPQEMVDLFYDLNGLARFSETQSEVRDVCLGFCYDQYSAMGWLYSNQRCRNDGHGVVCR
jgi:hypothetical protein